MTTNPTPAADPLYELAPAEFVAARNALAKELKAAGDAAQAALVTKLRRPTPVAYGLNVVARREPAVLIAALDAGTALKAAFDAAVAGDAGELRTATAADRDALRALAEAVAGVLRGNAVDLAQKVTATVRAATADAEVDATLRAGRLDAEHAASGFGLDDMSAAPPTAPPRDDLAPRRQAKAAKEARQEVEREAQERRDRQRREGEHRRRVAQLEARAARAAEKADAAEEAARVARAAATAAAEALTREEEAGPG